MAVTTTMYVGALQALANAEIDWEADTIKVALTTSSYTPSATTHDYFDDIDNEVSATGYTSGGAAIANTAATQSGSTYQYDGDDVTWGSSTITARYAIVYDASPGSAATNPLICYIDFGSDQSSSSGNFTITWDSTGVFVGTAT